MIFLYILFILVCVLLMVSILLQSGKGEGLSGTFGGSGQYLGGRAAATFLTRTTTGLAAAFMLLSIVIAILSSSGPSREVDRTSVQEAAGATAAPSVLSQPAAPAEQAAPAGDQAAPAAGQTQEQGSAPQGTGN